MFLIKALTPPYSSWINGILLAKLLWPIVKKTDLSSGWEKLLKIEAESREFAKIFEITRTIYLNSERSEQFLVTYFFFWLVPGGFSYLIN